MNKKTINTVLIVFTFFVWAAVFYKFFIKKKEANLERSSNAVVTSQEIEFNEEKDVFYLNLNERDPFKVGEKVRITTSTVPKIKKPTTSKPLSSQIIWPKIEYFGFLKGSQHETKLAVIKINNRLYRKRENEDIEELRIKKAYSDSIIVAVGNEIKTIKKK